MFKHSFDSYYYRISFNGRSASYPVISFTAKSAWRDFYRGLRYYKEL